MASWEHNFDVKSQGQIRVDYDHFFGDLDQITITFPKSDLDQITITKNVIEKADHSRQSPKKWSRLDQIMITKNVI